MRSYYRKKRGILESIEDKIGKENIPLKTVEIPVIQTPKVDKRTKKGKQVLKEYEIIPAHKTRKTELEDDTIETYIGNINRIHKVFADGKNLKPIVKTMIGRILRKSQSETVTYIPVVKEMPYLYDIDNVIKTLRAKHQKSDNTFKTYLLALTVLCSHIEPLKEAYQKLIRIAKDLNTSVENIRSQNKSKEEDKAKIIDLSERRVILENIDKLNDMRDKLLYALYTLIPPRRLDNRQLLLTDETNIDNLNDKNNYIILGKTMKRLYNKYKTVKQYKQQLFDVPDDLANIIREYIQVYNLKSGDFLFHLKKDKRLMISQSNFSTLLGNVFKKIHGVEVSVDFIRQSYATMVVKSNKSLQEREEIATQMAHSVIQQLKYSKHLD
jgi:hypothetical protein